MADLGSNISRFDYSAYERDSRSKEERLRIRDLEIQIGDAKLIKAEAEAVMQAAKQRLLALGIALRIKAGADTSDFEPRISGYFSDMLSDTFGGVVSEMENRL